MITIAETAPFQRKIAALLSDEERADLIAYLAEHPGAGVLIQGTGGIRKLRWARRGGGEEWRYSRDLLLSQRSNAALPIGSVRKERKGKYFG